MCTTIFKILDYLSDQMTFGALKRCTLCEKGQLEFRSGVGYYCSAYIDEWASCATVYTAPTREIFVVPEKLKRKHQFL